MNVYSCYLCDAKVAPSQRIDLGREHCICPSCSEAMHMASCVTDPRFSRAPGTVSISWEVDGVSGQTVVDRGRLTWELSAFLRGGYKIISVEAQ